MIIISTFLEALATILSMIINVYIIIVIISALITWIRPDPYNPIVQALYRLTEPVYDTIRRYIPTAIAGIDLAPIILLLALQFIQLFFVKLLFALAQQLST